MSYKERMMQRRNKMKFDVNMGGINILTLVFLILKLCGVIKWSWWFVFLPSILFFILPFVVIGSLFLICMIGDKYFN